MKALLCRAFGPVDTLTLEDVPDPKPGASEVLVNVRACGINFPDTLVVQGKYQFKPAFPFSPGGEVAGVVEALGSGVTGVKGGDHVVAIGPAGGKGEKVRADSSKGIPLPGGVDFVTASCLPTAYGTTLHALRDRAQLREGETLLVLGAAGGGGARAGRDRRLGSGRWQVHRAGPAGYGVGGAVPRHRLRRRRHPAYSAQPDAPEGLLDPRCVLGHGHDARARAGPRPAQRAPRLGG